MIVDGSFERSERDNELLGILARGEREIAAGQGYDLEIVLAEADDLLDEESVIDEG